MGWAGAHLSDGRHRDRRGDGRRSRPRRVGAPAAVRPRQRRVLEPAARPGPRLDARLAGRCVGRRAAGLRPAAHAAAARHVGRRQPRPRREPVLRGRAAVVRAAAPCARWAGHAVVRTSPRCRDGAAVGDARARGRPGAGLARPVRAARRGSGGARRRSRRCTGAGDARLLGQRPADRGERPDARGGRAVLPRAHHGMAPGVRHGRRVHVPGRAAGQPVRGLPGPAGGAAWQRRTVRRDPWRWP